MRVLASLSAVLAGTPAGPPAPQGGDPAALAEIEGERHRIQMAGLGTLTGWATLNLAVGGAAFALGTRDDADPTRWFHAGNAAWNSVNLVLGVSGLVGEQLRWRRGPVAAEDALRQGRRSAIVFAVNTGLDFVYVGAGIGLGLWGQTQAARDRGVAVGFGRALVLQGTFLGLFDATMWALHAELNQSLRARRPFALRLTPGPTPQGAGLALRF